ncbi:MAG: hypothetical protein ACRC7O_05320 [Fimbriiglobus sp.]
MRAWLFALLAAVVFTPAGTLAAADPTPEDVVKKAVRAHGGADALSKLKAGEYRMKGTIALPVGECAFTGEVAYLLPDKYKMTLDINVKDSTLALVQVANGKDVRTTVDGKPQKTSDAQKAEALQAAAMQEMTQLTPLLDDKKYTLKPAKSVAVGKLETTAITVTADGFKPVTLVFDADTGRLVRTSRKGLAPGGRDDKEVLEESTLSDYKEVSGVLVPMAMTVTHDGKTFMTVTVSGVKLSEKLDPKVFAGGE